MCRIMPRRRTRGHGRGRGGGRGPIPQVTPPQSSHESEHVEQLSPRLEHTSEEWIPIQLEFEGAQLCPLLEEVLARLGLR